MAIIKSYSDLQQSSKLAEILPLESADMCFIAHSELINIHEPFYKKADKEDTPCWSLSALLNVLDFPSLTQNKEDEWEICVIDKDNDGYIEMTASNPIDACYELILKLHKRKML